MPASAQLRNTLSAHLGPHAANELLHELGKVTDLALVDDEAINVLHRDVDKLKESLDAALIRIEHLERANMARPAPGANTEIQGDPAALNEMVAEWEKGPKSEESAA